jgi:hypothetical protein
MERVHQHDPGETAVGQPVVRHRGVHQADVDEQRVESAVHPEHLLHPDRADERRQNHRREDQHAEEVFPNEIIPMADQRQRERDGQRRERAGNSESECVPQPLAIDRIAEDRGEVIQREKVRTIRPSPFERLLHDHPGGVDEKHREQGAHDDRDQHGVAAFHRMAVAGDLARAMASALR